MVDRDRARIKSSWGPIRSAVDVLRFDALVILTLVASGCVVPAGAEPPCPSVLDVPAHADPNFEPDTGLWAWVVGPGSVYASKDSRHRADVRSPTEFDPYRVEVLDVGEGPMKSRRVFVLCDEVDLRLGYWQAARDLQPTNRERTLLVGQAPIPAIIDETTPGVRLPPGVAQVEMPTASSPVRARYEGFALRVEGWIAASSVDVVAQTETSTPEYGLIDGEIVGGEVAVHDAPGGVAFAWFSPSWPPLSVRRLDTRDDFVLVRYSDEVTVVGWIAAAAFESRPPRIQLPQVAKGGGGGMRGSDITRLERGTLLVDQYTDIVLGVVMEPTDFRCWGPCEEPAPVVESWACGHDFQLRAIRPHQSPRSCRSHRR
jgi:hypothetical protein